VPNQFPSRGGAIWTEHDLQLNHVTIAGNTATEGGGLYEAGGQSDMFATLLAGNQGGACAGLSVDEEHHNLADDVTGQGKGAKPLTTLTLVEALSCPKSGKANIAAKKKKKRRLWGDGSGNFQTKGKHSAATVVGTKWLVEDRCDSTLTRVVSGRVSVRDFAKKKTVIVRAGKKYVAEPKK
jgi:hypothetical protein